MVIVFNPVAGRRRASLLWRVLDVLVANGVRLELAETHRAGHAEALAREAVAAGETMVVAAGGDGTIAEVANGLMGSTARLGVIPLGTANVLAHELALPFAPREVAAALAFKRTKLLWPGLAHGGSDGGGTHGGGTNGAAGTRLFVQMLGVGFDAHVVHTLPPGLKRVFGRGAYVLQSLHALFDYDFKPIHLRLDGAETTAASVIVTKGVLYGGTYRLAADAVPAEPGFSVVLFDHGGPAAAMLYGAALPINLLGRAPGVRHIRAGRIDFLGNARLPAQADGDAAGCAPLYVVDAPGPIQVITG